MGFFIKNKDLEEEPVEIKAEKQATPVQRIKLRDGRECLELNYYNDEKSFGQFYDTTRIIIDCDPTMKDREGSVYRAFVSWYGQDDVQILAPKMELQSRKNQFTEVQLGLEFEKLFEDADYQKALMVHLLDQKRVQQYMQRGLEDNPERPCGNYVGKVIQDKETGRYKKAFSIETGKAVHNSFEQIQRRIQHKAEQEKEKQARIADLRRKQAEAQIEIDELEK